MLSHIMFNILRTPWPISAKFDKHRLYLQHDIQAYMWPTFGVHGAPPPEFMEGLIYKTRVAQFLRKALTDLHQIWQTYAVQSR